MKTFTLQNIVRSTLSHISYRLTLSLLFLLVGAVMSITVPSDGVINITAYVLDPGLNHNMPIITTPATFCSEISTPKVRLVKTASMAGTGAVGDVITYTFTVTNTGNVPLSTATIADAKLSLTALVVTPSSLAPAAIGTATATYTVT